MNNINHHTNNNNINDINNGSNNTNNTINTTITTTTATTTTTTTNNIGSVSSNTNNNNNNSNNKTNNNSSNNQNTLHVDTTTTTTTHTLITQETAETDVNVKSIANPIEIGARNKNEARADTDDGSNKNANDTENSNRNANDDGNDKCDKFIAIAQNNNKQNIDLTTANSDADRDKDLSVSATTTIQSTNTSQLNEQQQQTVTTFDPSSSNSNVANTISTYAPNSGTNTNTNVSSNDAHLISNKNLSAPHTSSNSEYNSKAKSNATQRQTRRHLRTKALLESLPCALKTRAYSDTARASNAELIKFYDELFAGNNELLQKLSINNPFYRFRKQSTSLKEMRALACVERRLRKFRSDTDILNWRLTPTDDEEQNSSSDDSVEHERLARVILGHVNGNAVMFREDVDDDLDYAAQYGAQQKRGETAVQLTATDGSVVVVLDTKHPGVVVSRPITLNRIEELLSGGEDDEHGTRGFLLDAVAAERAFADSTSINETDNSTVITNPFSIFHDDDTLMLSVNTRLRAASSASQQQRSLKKRQRSERSLRRLFETSNEVTNAKRGATSNGISAHQTGMSARQHYLNGIPVGRFERQDFVSTAAALTMKETCKSSKLKPKLAFKNLSLRKIHKSASGLPATTRVNPQHACDTISELNALPRMKKLKIAYPNRTQSIHSALDAGTNASLSIGLVNVTDAAAGGKHSYFERIQAKTRQGFQKLRAKCRNLKPGHNQHTANSSGFTTLAKDDSFRFIGDRARISSYESKCAALNGNGTRQHATIYKSYKSEIDLSKNLHYLDAYLEENFEQDLRNSKQSAHSVGRVAARHLPNDRELVGSAAKVKGEATPQYAKTQSGRAHKRSNSAAHKTGAALKPTANASNYENLGTLPMTKRGCSDSMSSSDYASVFSGPTVAVEPATPSSAGGTETITQSLADDTSSNAGLRYEHPKMSQYFFNKLDLEGSADLLLAAEGQSGSEGTGNCFFSAASEDDLDEDVEEGFVNLGAHGDAAFLVDYRRVANLDANLGALDNEVDNMDFTQQNGDMLAATRQRTEEGAIADWYQKKPERGGAYERNSLLTAYNENLAESHFYRSLNQHLQQEQQQQQQSELFADIKSTEDNGGGIGTALLAERMSADDGDKDFHYESYLEHFYRAKSGQHERKANSIGYDDERIHIADVANRHEIEDYAESGYITRSAFKRAARGRKAGGSALDLRQSALMLIGENLRRYNDDNRNKGDDANVLAHKKGVDCYARQAYGNNDAWAVGAKSVTTANNLATASMPMQNNLTLKNKSSDIMAAITCAQPFGSGYTAPLLTTRTRAKIMPYAESMYGATSPAEYGANKRADILEVYNEGAGKATTAALTTTSALLHATDAPTKLQQHTSGSNSKTNVNWPQQQQRVKQQQQQQLATPHATNAAMFIEPIKDSAKCAKNVEALGSTNNRYMLDNMRRQYQQQQHKQKSTNSVSSSLSLSTSSSSNSSVSQPVTQQQLQQQQQQEQLLLPSTKIATHGKYAQAQQQQQQLPVTGTTYHARRSSNTSNASSSDNFDTFIAVRSAKASTNVCELTSPIAAPLQADYAISKKRTGAYQQQQRQLIGAHARAQTNANNYPTSPSSGGSSSTVPLISALNYYGTGATSGGGGASSTASASASASSSSSSSSTNQRYALTANISANASNNYALLAQMHYANKSSSIPAASSDGAAESGAYTTTLPQISPAYNSERKPFILEYEC